MLRFFFTLFLHVNSHGSMIFISHRFLPDRPRPFLIDSQDSRTPLLAGLLLLVAPLERRGGGVVPTDVVEVLDLVDPDDPVLAGERLVKDVERWADLGELRATDSVLGLSRGEEGVVVVVGHLVPVVVVSKGKMKTR